MSCAHFMTYFGAISVPNEIADVRCHDRCLLKKSGCRTPRIEMEEIGPSFDFVLRRTHLASDDLYKLAHRQPKALKVNITWIESIDIFSKDF